MNLTLRMAERSEIDWVNQRYDAVQFAHSNFEREVLVIAQWDGERVGLGRLVPLCNGHLELGGIYVLDPFRGKGIAKEIVKFLMKQADRSQIVYCIPFAHLIPFYEQMGFVACPDLEKIPEELMRKCLRYNQIDPQPTKVLRRVAEVGCYLF